MTLIQSMTTENLLKHAEHLWHFANDFSGDEEDRVWSHETYDAVLEELAERSRKLKSSKETDEQKTASNF